MRKLILTLTLWFCAAISFGQPFGNEWIDYSKTYYKFPVRENRLYRISKSVLTGAGIGETPAQDFQLWRNGVEVAIYTTEDTGPLAANGYIEFIGKMNDGKLDEALYDDPANHVNKDYSYFSDTAWYYLTISPGRTNLRIKSAINNAATSTLRPDSFFMHTATQRFYNGWNYGSGTFIPLEIRPNGETFGVVVRNSELNGGEGWCSNGFNKDYPLGFTFTNLLHYAQGPGMQLAISVSGNFQAPRNILTYANDSLVKSTYANYFEMRRDTVNNLPASVIKSDGVALRFSSDNGYYWENNIVNLITLKYPRRFNFQNNRYWELSIPANAQGNLLKMGAFRSDNVATILYDLTNNKRYVGNIKGDSSFFGLEPSAQSRLLAIANQSSFLFQVTTLTRKNFVDYAAAANQGDYLIITNKLLLPSTTPNNIEAYKNYRASLEGGAFNPQVYDIDELAEQFIYGLRKHPFAIRNFVRFADARFSTKPKFVFLVGKGTYYEMLRATGNFTGKDLIGMVPTFGTPSSDNMLLAANNLNPTPTVPIGRLSAISNEEVGTYLSKVKDYEKLLRNGNAAAAERIWQKEILHLIGGDDLYLSTVLTGFMNNYRSMVVDTPISANVQKFQRVNNPNFANDMHTIEKRIGDGVGLLTYFGHSSASSIDFNLGSPETYNNTDGKFPIFIANGCRAGNIFDFNANRIYSKNQSISDNFIFAKNKGAISFISNSDYGLLNYMNLYTKMFYQAFGKTHYGKSIGEIHREAIRAAYSITGPGDLLNRMNLQQVVLHSDPAIIPFPYTKPDYATANNLISVIPAPSVANDSVWVKVIFGNIGRSAKQSVDYSISRELPDGKIIPLATGTIDNLLRTDSVMVKVGLKGMFDAGTNYIIATIDPADQVQEMSETNNKARYAFELNTNAIYPVFPYDLSIVKAGPFKLTASTANPAAKAATYRLQIDTTRNFNSSWRVTNDITSIGGAIQFQPAVNLRNNTVYYWRVSPVTAGIATSWVDASFVYNTALEPGFNQSHYFQHRQSNYVQMELDSLSRLFEFGNKNQNLYVEHGIYASSGTEDGHFSVVVNGLRNIYSACLGQSIIFNLFDSLSFAQWDNSAGGRYGSGYYCGQGKEYNFEFKYFNHTNRKLIMNFIDSIPKGTYVVARMVLDAPYDSSKVEYWKRDTLIYGKGKSLYHSLLNQGFKDIDSLNRPRTFALVFRKDDSTRFKAQYALSEGLYDRINKSFTVYTRDTAGSVASPYLGPAVAWKTLAWNPSLHPKYKVLPSSSLDIWGRMNDGTEVLLQTLATDQTLVDVSNIDAGQYPYLKLAMHTAEPQHAKPAQLDFWRLSYEPLADGALSAKDYWQWTSDTLAAIKDSLKFGIAFKNVSNYPLGSTAYTLHLGNSRGEELLLKAGTLKSLISGDTAIIGMAGKTDTMYGRYYLRLEVNGMRNPGEQTYFNNLAYIPLFVDTLKDAYTLLNFDAKPINNNITASWSSAWEVRLAKYEVLYGTDSLQMQPVGSRLPGNQVTSLASYSLEHTSPVFGNNYYRLRVTDNYGNITYSDFKKIFVGLATFDAVPQSNQVLASWKFLNEIKVAKYELEHSLNNGAWSVAGTQNPLNTGLAELNYSLAHLKPGIGENRYRLKITDAYGNITYSTVKQINISLLNFDAALAGKSVQLNWRFFNEINIRNYVLEGGTDSTKLSSIVTQLPTANGAGQVDYGYLHTTPKLGYNYYRLKVTDGNGNIIYSAIKSIFVGDATIVTVVPNPFTNLVRIVTSDNSTKWQLGLYDGSGKLVLNQTGSGTVELNTAHLPKGSYYLRYQKGDLILNQKLEKL